MPQINSGLATIMMGTNRVIGNANADWSLVVPGFSLFTFPEQVTPFEAPAWPTPILIQGKTPPAASASHFWELTLVVNSPNPNATGRVYVIHKDFTPVRVLSLTSIGDQYGYQHQNRNWLKLAQEFAGG